MVEQSPLPPQVKLDIHNILTRVGSTETDGDVLDLTLGSLDALGFELGCVVILGTSLGTSEGPLDILGISVGENEGPVLLEGTIDIEGCELGNPDGWAVKLGTPDGWVLTVGFDDGWLELDGSVDVDG